MTTNGDAQPAAQSPAQSPAGPTAEPAALTGTPILDQAFDADSLYALRAAVAAHVTEAALAPGRADDLVIAVHELAANAVRHGAGHGRLRIWRSEAALLCEVSDDGLPDVAKTPRPGAPPPAPASRWSARSPTRPPCAPARPARWPPSPSPSGRPARRSAWTGKT